MSKTKWVTIGMTCSLTGRYSHLGAQALLGVQAWIRDTNVSGGLQINEGRRLRLIYYNDNSNQSQCASLFYRLITKDKVDVLIGPYSSGLALAAARVARRHRRLLWNQGGSLDSINEAGGGWVISTLTPASMYFRGVLDLAQAAGMSVSKVAIVYTTTGAFPHEVATGSKIYCQQRGLGPITIYRYLSERTDFKPIVDIINNEGPSLILGVGKINDDIKLAESLFTAGSAPRLVGLIAAPLSYFKNKLGVAADGIVGPSQWEKEAVFDPDHGPNTSQVMQSLENTSSEIDYPMAQAYGGCLAARLCIEAAGSLDDNVLRDTARNLIFTTFYGKFQIDRMGRQLGHQMNIIQWQGNKKVIVWPKRLAEGSLII